MTKSVPLPYLRALIESIEEAGITHITGLIHHRDMGQFICIGCNDRALILFGTATLNDTVAIATIKFTDYDVQTIAAAMADAAKQVRDEQDST